MSQKVSKFICFALNLLWPGSGLAVIGFTKIAMYVWSLFCISIFALAYFNFLQHFLVFLLLSIAGLLICVFFLFFPFFQKKLTFVQPIKKGCFFIFFCFIVQIATIYPVRTHYFYPLYCENKVKPFYAGDYVMISKRFTSSPVIILKNTSTHNRIIWPKDKPFPDTYQIDGYPIYVFWPLYSPLLGQKL